jgi:hypothetical protein
MIDPGVPRTLIVAPWFGPWPAWIEVFLLACKYNPGIDWLLLGDCGLPGVLPVNVRLERTGFAHYRERCAQALGLSLHWERPYKLCDLRPALGVVHAADIAGYELWGWSDLDLVYGDLASCIARRAPGYAALSFSGTHLSGDLCLFRTCDPVVGAFRSIRDWQRLMADERSHTLDEIALSWVFAPPGMEFVMFPENRRSGRGAIVVEREADALSAAHRASFENSFTTPSGIGLWHDGTPRHPRVWHWRSGVLSTSLHPGYSYPYLNLLNHKSDFYWRRTLHAWGYPCAGASPLWDDPSGRPRDPIDLLERRGFAVDRRGFSALSRERDAQ